jgi:hypothetical protein
MILSLSLFALAGYASIEPRGRGDNRRGAETTRQSGNGVLRVDGKDGATQTMEHTLPFILAWDESLDIGSDTGTPVEDRYYPVPFNFTGKLNKITLTIDRPKLSPEDIKKLEQAKRNNRVSQ